MSRADISRELTAHGKDELGALQATTAWLIRGRWLAYPVALAVVWTLAGLLHVVLPTLALLLLLLLGLGSNAIALWVLYSQPQRARQLLTGVLATDIVLTTALLQQTGGPANPLLLAFLLPLIVAATSSSRRTTWGLFGLCVAGLLVVEAWHRPLLLDHGHRVTAEASNSAAAERDEEHAHTGSDHDAREHAAQEHAAREHGAADHAHTAPSHHATAAAQLDAQTHLWLHARGAWLSVAMFTLVIVYMLRWAFAQKTAALRAAAQAAEHHKRVADVATLAAGAAHALGTPLATISVIVSELERSLERGLDEERLRADVRDIAEQVERCRLALRDVAEHRTPDSPEAPTRVELATLLERARLRTERPAAITLSVETTQLAANWLPYQSVLHVVVGLLDNALQASPNEPVRVSARQCDQRWRIEIFDRGTELSSERAIQLGREPQSTKREGLGIGLFLGRALLERLGGSLALERVADGTRAVLELPVNGDDPRSAA